MALLPWRAIVTPHPDVAAGHYRQAEFAADLAERICRVPLPRGPQPCLSLVQPSVDPLRAERIR